MYRPIPNTYHFVFDLLLASRLLHLLTATTSLSALAPDMIQKFWGDYTRFICSVSFETPALLALLNKVNITLTVI